MGFKDLFKVRKPGNGNAVQKKFNSEGKKLPDVGMQKNDFISKDKKSV
jgi:hypothetical protein